MPIVIDADRIIPRLWQGSDPPRGTRLREAGVDVLVLCARENQHMVHEFPGVQVIHAPMDDDVHVPVEEAMAAAAAAARAYRRGKRVMVCCHMGWNRSGLVTALALWMLDGRMSGRAAVAHVQACRDSALSNRSFVAFLSSLAPRRRARSEPPGSPHSPLS